MAASIEEQIRAGLAEQLAAFRRAIGNGMPRTGWKVAMSDPRAMERLGLAAPLVAWLDGGALLETGATYPSPPGSRLLIEAEMAVRLGADRAIVAVMPALEIVDFSRPADTVQVMLGHSVFHAATVLGPEGPRPAWPPDGWPAISVNGDPKAALDPLNAAPDLDALLSGIDTLLHPDGEALKAGDLVITGSLTTPVPAKPGDTVEADFGPLGAVSVVIA